MKNLLLTLLLFAAALASPAQQTTPVTTLATLNDLLARAPRANETVAVLRGYNGQDWGGTRFFTQTPSSALVTNIAHILAITNTYGAQGQYLSADRTNTVQDSRWWRVISGDTNINAAVQDMVDYGQEIGGVIVTFPKGSYTLSAWPPIYLTNNTTIAGVPGQTIFNFSGATNQVQYGTAIHNATNASVTGISYWWPTNTIAVPNPETVIAVDIRSSKNITVDQVNATNLKGINIGGTQGSSDIYVSRFTGTASPQVGGAATYVSHLIVSDSVFQGSSGDHTSYNVVGFDVEPNEGQTVTDVVFARCRFLNNEEEGLTLVSSADRTMSNIRLVDCFSSNNGASGLSIQAGEDVVVTGWQSTNDYSGFAFSGYGSIYATLSKNLTIQGSTIRGNANNSGINLAGVSGVTVTGNTIDGVTLDGIQISDATAREFTGVISLVGNRILRAGRYGLFYSGVVGVHALGNTIIQSGQNGVHATFSINNVFANNLIAESGDSGNGYYGMRLAASSTNSISGNTFLENLVSLNTTAQAGSSSTVQFGTNAMAFDGYYNDCWITIESGTGSGQTRIASAYAASTLTATVSTNWTTAPDATSVLLVQSGNPNYSQSGAIYLDDERCVNNNVSDNNLGGLSVSDSGTGTKGVMIASTVSYAMDSQSFGSAAIVRESDGYTTEFRNVSSGVGQVRIFGYRPDSSNYERIGMSITPGIAAFISAETAGTGADNLKMVLSGSGTESVYARYSGQSEVVSRWSGSRGSEPASPQIGDAFWHTGLSALGFWNGTSWIYPQNRTNHYGTQSYTTITGLGTLATINDAPADGKTYGRKDNAWEEVASGSFTNLDNLTVTNAARFGGNFTISDTVGGTDRFTLTGSGINSFMQFASFGDLLVGSGAGLYASSTNNWFYNGINQYWPGTSDRVWLTSVGFKNATPLRAANILDSTTIDWTTTSTTNVTPSIKSQSLSTNLIDSTFYSLLMMTNSGGSGSTTTNYLDRTLFYSRGQVIVGTTNALQSLVTGIPAHLSKTISAGSITTNFALHVTAGGTMTSTNDNWSNNKFTVKVGGLSIVHTITDDTSGVSLTDAPWDIDCHVTVTATGTNATVYATSVLRFRYDDGGVVTYPWVFTFPGVVSGTLDTTGSVDVDVLYSMDTSGQEINVKCNSVVATVQGAEVLTSGGGSSSPASYVAVNGTTNNWNFNSTTPAASTGYRNFAFSTTTTNAAIQDRAGYFLSSSLVGTNNSAAEFVVFTNNIPAGWLRAGSRAQLSGLLRSINNTGSNRYLTFKLYLGSGIYTFGDNNLGSASSPRGNMYSADIIRIGATNLFVRVVNFVDNAPGTPSASASVVSTIVSGPNAPTWSQSVGDLDANALPISLTVAMSVASTNYWATNVFTHISPE